MEMRGCVSYCFNKEQEEVKQKRTVFDSLATGIEGISFVD